MPEVSAPFLTNVWNIEIVSQHKFSDNLKLADVTPVFKKDDANLTKNYRPVSVLPIVSKIFERLLQKQTISYIDQYLSNFKVYSKVIVIVKVIVLKLHKSQCLKNGETV